jgi:hypothetical protein
MLAVHEFHEAYRRYYRWAVAGWVTSFAVVVAPLVAFGLDPILGPSGTLRSHLEPLVASYVVSIAKMLVFLAFGAIALLGLVLLNSLAARLVRDPRLICPYCARSLVFPSNSYSRVVATRACPRCNREILTDPYPAEPVPLSSDDAEARASRWRQGWRRTSLQFAVLFSGFMIGTWILEAVEEEGAISAEVSEALGLALMLAFSSWGVWRIVRNRLLWRMQIRCPRCGHQQDPSFVARFRGCGACSQPLVAAAPTPA